MPPDIVTRQYRRTVYDFALWAKHRDVNRYLYNLKTIPGSRIIRTLGQPMGIVLAWAALFGFYETCLDAGVLPSYLPKLTLTSAEPQGLTSFALSLLLVFRTNSSYGRFDEARKIWGGILNRARNIANQAVTFIPPEDAAGREAVGKWTVGFCRALQAHLQEDADLRAELQKAQPRWTEREIDILCSAQHRPIKAISMLSELTRQLPISQFQALQMQENVTFFYDALGGCERLLRTPIPVSYTRHTARFLTIWLALLPLGLWERYHWSMLPVIALIGFLLLGIDEIGISIEEPFGILPLDAICTRAQTDVVSLLKDDPAVSQYITDVREGRVRAPADPPAPPKAAPAPPPGVVPAATVARSVSPSGSGSSGEKDVARTMASLFNNVKAGVGAVAPGKPPSPARNPSPPRVRPPARAGSPGGPNPFPPASAGTGRAPPPSAAMAPAPPAPRPWHAEAPGSNGKASSGPAAAAPIAGAGFTMSFSGLGSGLGEAAAKLSKLADSMTSGSPAGQTTQGPSAAKLQPEPVSAPIAAAAQEPKRAAPQPPAVAAAPKPSAPAPPAPAVPAPSATSSSDEGRSGSRVGVNWRAELSALKANRKQEGSDAEELDQVGTAAGGNSVWGSSADEADDEAMRRFGGLAGRSRSATSIGTATGGNGNGMAASANGNDSTMGYAMASSGSGETSRQRPRTRPDWRDQL